MTYRIVFMGTPDFAVPALRALHADGHDIAAVYSQPPRRAGRGKKLQLSPVHRCAEALGLGVECPPDFKTPDARSTLKAYGADIAVVAAYGLILPQAVLDMAPLGFLNIHGSLLPRWRGAAPIQRAIEAGDAHTGITIMQMEAGLDTGPMGLKGMTPIGADTTAGELHDQLATMGAQLITQTLREMAAGTAAFSAQDDAEATYAKKILKEEAALDFTALTGEEMARKVHALSPFPGAYIMANGKRLKLLKVRADAAQSGLAGSTLDDQLTIACAHGAIQPVLVQPAGKSPMALADYLRGQPMPAGTQF